MHYQHLIEARQLCRSFRKRNKNLRVRSIIVIASLRGSRKSMFRRHQSTFRCFHSIKEEPRKRHNSGIGLSRMGFVLVYREVAGLHEKAGNIFEQHWKQQINRLLRRTEKKRPVIMMEMEIKREMKVAQEKIILDIKQVKI